MNASLPGAVNTGPTGLEEMPHLLRQRTAREFASRLAILMAPLLHWQTPPLGTTSRCQTITLAAQCWETPPPGPGPARQAW